MTVIRIPHNYLTTTKYLNPQILFLHTSQLPNLPGSPPCTRRSPSCWGQQSSVPHQGWRREGRARWSVHHQPVLSRRTRGRVYYKDGNISLRSSVIMFLMKSPWLRASITVKVSRDALLVIHIPLLHFSFYPNIPQRNDTSPFWKSTVPTSGVTLTYFIW